MAQRLLSEMFTMASQTFVGLNACIPHSIQLLMQAHYYAKVHPEEEQPLLGPE